jgi:hypothetical protein
MFPYENEVVLNTVHSANALARNKQKLLCFFSVLLPHAERKLGRSIKYPHTAVIHIRKLHHILDYNPASITALFPVYV